ncbi:low-density lipoprotein receptor-related protein 6-like [Mercenaria mercenaria]|uniref:low-density lipoprotein receptor-related protein 6-like n=1 Tax=Mercenaria mercenaria TaxID=6596 RepID=UPI00234ECB89|nr:low-density lipoprotein receptor-related protein 6-like [Mercenaria mercenaria]
MAVHPRPSSILLWNDEDGYIGMISTYGTDERKYDSITTGGKRHAITVYKNFIISTTAESRQFDIIYELDPKATIHTNLHTAYDGPVLDFHVYESTLQPSDLEPCEVDNGGCEHICLPGNELKCACFLGYILDEDHTSCKTAILSDNFFVILDTVQGGLYQIDQETKTPYTIEIDDANVPTTLTFDPVKKDVIWVDIAKHAVKKKRLGSTEEIAVRSGVDDTRS